MDLIILFIVLNIANVIIQTVKSIATIKCGKGVAALVNALAYGLYTFVIIYMNCELNIWLKAGVVAFANLTGVYIVKWLEERNEKTKLWLVRFTIDSNYLDNARKVLKMHDISNSYIELQKYAVFDCYCNTKAQTSKVLEICKTFKGKAFATENKLY